MALSVTSLVAVHGCGASAPQAEQPDESGSEQDAEPQACPDQLTCTKQCDAGDAASCEWLGRMYETGEGAPQNYDAAAKAYDKACEGGLDDSCAHLAMMYDIGLAVEEDPDRAAELYGRACASGNRWACNRGEQLKP
jgi:TPR repeat protein